MKRILIPTDFSETAHKAAAYVANLHVKEPCHYEIIHTYYTPSTDVSVANGQLAKELKDGADQRLETYSKDFRSLKHHPETTFSFTAIYGMLSMVIEKYDRDGKLDLIAMGTTGASGIKEALFGSNAAAVARKTKTAVLCVPNEAKLNMPEHILLASDYSHINDNDSLEPLLDIAETHDARISILNVSRKPVTAGEAVEGMNLHYELEDVKHEYYGMETDDVETGILDFAHIQDVDMITVLKHHHSFIERIFKKSISRSLTMHSDIPLLILKE